MNRGGATSSPKVEQSKSSVSSEIQDTYIAEEKEVTYDNLKSSWNQYTKSIEKQNARLYSILKNCTPELTNNQDIIVKVESAFQEGELIKNRGPLIEFLRKNLKNSTIQVEVVVQKNENTVSVRAYTAADKLNAMMQKNPALQTLKEKFNLDIN